MECPSCGHVSEAELSKCTSCGETFARKSLETLGHLGYLRSWLDEQRESLGAELHTKLREEVSIQIRTLRDALVGPEEAMPEVMEPARVRAPEVIADELHLIEAVQSGMRDWLEMAAVSPGTGIILQDHLAGEAEALRVELGDSVVETEPVREIRLLDFLTTQLPLWSEELQLNIHDVQSLEDCLEQRRFALSLATPQITTPADELEVAVKAEPVRVTAPEPPPVPRKRARPQVTLPKINWAKWWERAVEMVVSGALLRGLLYLGALMIVVSAVVLVVRFWDIFPQFVQLLFIAAVPTVFYGAGWAVRQRLSLPQAGSVLTGIGAILVAVDFAAVYQFGGLATQIELNVYWLGASLVSTVIYFVTAWRLPTEFMGYITLLGITSFFLALTRLLGLPIEWVIASIAAVVTAQAELGTRLSRMGDRWNDILRAVRRYTNVLLPACLVAVYFVPGEVAFGQMATCLFVALGFGIVSWRFPHHIYAHAAAWSLLGSIAFSFRLIGIPAAWHAPTIGGVAIFYILAGKWLEVRPLEDSPSYRYHITAIKYASWALTALVIASGFLTLVLNVWSGILALTLSALILGWMAFLYERPILILTAGGLLSVPFTIALSQWFTSSQVPQAGAWLMTGWAGLALAYIGVAMALRKAERYAVWLNLLAHLLTPAACLGLVVNWIATSETWHSGPTWTALVGAISVYAASAAIHDTKRYPGLSDYLTWLPGKLEQTIFLWPIGLLLPIWLAVAWIGMGFQQAWIGPLLGGLGLAYVGLGEWLHLRRAEYRLPPHTYAYILVLAGISMALRYPGPLVAALYIAVGTLATQAMIYRSYWVAAIASLLFLWPFQLSLELLQIRPHAQSLAFALLASFGYIPLGIRLQRTGRQFALPAYVIGYSISAYAVLASLLGRFGAYSFPIPWMGIVTPLLISGLLVFSTYHFKRSPFAWSAAITFPIAFGQILNLLNVSAPLIPIAWVGLAFGYLLIERMVIQRILPREVWLRKFVPPLTASLIFFCGLGVMLTAGDTITLLSGLAVQSHLQLIATQTLVVLLTVLATRLHRKHWPLYFAATLSFFPYTLSWLVYMPGLKRVEFAWVWMGLAAAWLLIGFYLDRPKARYAHGPYLVGYALAGLSLIRSMPDRFTNLLTLAVLILIAGLSQLAVHKGRHHAFVDLVDFIWRRPSTRLKQASNTFFFFITAYAFPVWLIQLLIQIGVPLAWRGLTLTLVSPLYVAIGLAARRGKPEYSWPFYSGGYALGAMGAMVAFNDQKLAIYALLLNTVVYASSAYIFRQASWLYLSNLLIPVVVLLTLHNNQVLISPWVSGTFMALSFLYILAGLALNRYRRTAPSTLSAFSMPFFAPAYLLSAISLAVASGEKFLALGIYSSGVVLYAISARVFREPVFLYPAVWLFAVPYYIGMTLTSLPTDWYGLGWLPLILAYVALGKNVFHKKPLDIKGLRTLMRALTHPAMPFYLLAYILSVSMMVVSRREPLPLTLAFGAGAALYFFSARMFRHYAWCYPGILAAHLAIASLYALRPTGISNVYIALPFLATTWVFALVGLAMSRRFALAPEVSQTQRSFTVLGRKIAVGRPPFVDHLLTPSWAQPFFLAVAVDVVVWQLFSLSAIEPTIVLGVGNAILLGMFSLIWKDRALVYGSLALLLLAFGGRLRWSGLPLPEALAWMGGGGLGLFSISIVVGEIIARTQRMANALALWRIPLERTAIFLTTLAVLGTLPALRSHGAAATAALAFAGILYLTLAYRGRHIRLSYLGMAMLELDWALMLIDRSVQQPQLFAIPAGLYFIGVGYLERRHGRKRFADIVESFGLAVLLISSFIQSVDGVAGFPYFVLLLIEGVLVLWWGAMQRRKIPFFSGLGMSTLNVVAQVIVLINVYDLQRWIIILGVGILLVTAAVFVERKREQIIARAKDWRLALETWE